MPNVTLEHILSEVQAVGDKVDRLEGVVTEHRVSVEHRLTKVETKGALFGALLGALTGFFASWGAKWH